MNRTLTPGELVALDKLIRPMTKGDKLRRLAQLVRAYTCQDIYIFHRLEYYTPFDRAGLHHPHSAFSIAAADPTLQEAGLQNGTVGEAQRFFELSNEDLHEFSCNCGGHISTAAMADRIEAIAARAP